MRIREIITWMPSLWCLKYETSNIFLKYVYCAGFIHQAHSKQLQGPPRNSGRHHCTYREIRTTINGQQTDPGLNLQLNRLGFILTYSTNKSMVEKRYALKAYKVSIVRCLKWKKPPRPDIFFCPYSSLTMILRKNNLHKWLVLLKLRYHYTMCDYVKAPY